MMSRCPTITFSTSARRPSKAATKSRTRLSCVIGAPLRGYSRREPIQRDRSFRKHYRDLGKPLLGGPWIPGRQEERKQSLSHVDTVPCAECGVFRRSRRGHCAANRQRCPAPRSLAHAHPHSRGCDRGGDASVRAEVAVQLPRDRILALDERSA